MNKGNGTSVPRCDFLLLFDIHDGNPNGDPDAGNAPRIDPETGHGLITDVCLKRKIRNFISLRQNGDGDPKLGYDIYLAERAILNQQHQRAYEALGVKSAEEAGKRQDDARRWMCQTFFDIRMFGAVMSTGKSDPMKNAGQVRGPVQLSFSRSLDPILSLEHSITRMAVTTEDEWKDQQKRQAGQARTMGRKETIPYALYECYGFVNPYLAQKTGFDSADLDLLWQSLARMFENDQSAARARMATRDLVVFEHASPLGNAPAHKLFDMIKRHVRPDLLEPKMDGAPGDTGSRDSILRRPPRSFDDYVVEIDLDGLPPEIKVRRLDGYELKDVTP